jgi:hypothetical protein
VCKDFKKQKTKLTFNVVFFSSCSSLVTHTFSPLLEQVIILARESGLRLELSDIPVKSLVPETLAVRLFSS